MTTYKFDPVFEAVLRQAVRDNIYEEAESVPDDDVLATMFTISEKHNARMRRLCAHEDRREQLRSIMKPTRKIAVAAMIAIAILFGALLTNPTVRAAVGEVIIEWYEKFTRFTGGGNDEFIEPRDWSPTYLPEGYVEVSVFEGDTIMKSYEDANENLLMFKYSWEDNDLLVDNEESEYSTTEIGGITYYVFDTDVIHKPLKIIWFNKGFSFYLSGYLDTETLLDIAKSVE